MAPTYIPDLKPKYRQLTFATAVRGSRIFTFFTSRSNYIVETSPYQKFTALTLTQYFEAVPHISCGFMSVA